MNQDYWAAIREAIETIYLVVCELRTAIDLVEELQDAGEKKAELPDHGG